MDRVLLLQPIDEDGMKILIDAGLEVQVAPSVGEQELCAIVGDYDAIMVRGMAKLTEPIIAAAKKCRIIARHGVGLETIDVAAATKLAIPVAFTPGANANAVAEHAVGLMMDVIKKNSHLCHRLKHEGDYSCRLKVTNGELSGKTLGLIGLGNIGRKVAQICKNGFNMSVLAYDPYVTQQMADQMGAPVQLVATIDEVIKGADILSLHLPSLQGSLIGERELAMLRQGAIVINTARGNLIDETALFHALQSGHLLGAGLDVLAEEPPEKQHPLFSLDQVTVTPHVAALTKEGNKNMAIGAARQIVDALAGVRPYALVNDVWDQRRC